MCFVCLVEKQLIVSVNAQTEGQMCDFSGRRNRSEEKSETDGWAKLERDPDTSLASVAIYACTFALVFYLLLALHCSELVGNWLRNSVCSLDDK